MLLLFALSITAAGCSIIGHCDYKSVSVPTDNDRDLTLNSSYELREVEAAMRSNQEYEIRGGVFGPAGEERGELYISRTFDGVRYTIKLGKDHLGRNTFKLHTLNFDGYPNGSVVGGASCQTPDRVIRGNVIRMIKDLPLSNQQRRELMENIRVFRGDLRPFPFL